MTPTLIPTTGLGDPDRTLTTDDVRRVLADGLTPDVWANQRVLVIVPDNTRSGPIGPVFAQAHELMTSGEQTASQIDVLIALGTHMALSREQMAQRLEVPVDELETRYPGVNIFNHEWEKEETFVSLGEIGEDEIEELSNGLLRETVDVRINRLVLAYDLVLIVGPVFPHEVVGFSGGNKYFFPGVSGPEVINFTHWLGAVMTSYEIIGSGYTPVRAVIDRAASLIPTPSRCAALVVRGDDLTGLYVGTPKEAWEAASQLSAQVHVRYLEHPVQRVLSIMPALYDDIWTAAKGMYKLEPVVAEGGEVVIYAPHIDEISYTHGRVLDEVGYHVRDYFLKQWDRFKDYPAGVLAHSTHLRGIGEYDVISDTERPRVSVTLATGISEERCRRLGLGYIDPATIDMAAWAADEGTLVVPKAGEILYRLKD